MTEELIRALGEPQPSCRRFSLALWSSPLVLCSLPWQHQGKLWKYSFREGSAILQTYFSPAVALGLMFPTQNPYCCTIRSKQWLWGWFGRRGISYHKATEITSVWALVEAGVSIYPCFCQKMLPWGTHAGTYLRHLLVWVLPAGAHGDGAEGKSE